VLLAAWAMALTPPDANYAPMNYEPAAAAAFDREKSNPDSNRCGFMHRKQYHASMLICRRILRVYSVSSHTMQVSQSQFI
jgi:hypothetical protein